VCVCVSVESVKEKESVLGRYFLKDNEYVWGGRV